MQNRGMKKRPEPHDHPSRLTLQAAVLDFIRRGQRAQATVEAMLAAELERRLIKWPTGRA
jgi:hypothetical protein